jgi:alpha-beta hydrolase superfamily lysophospholipase
MKKGFILVTLIALLLAALPVMAQEGPQPQRVEITASDGWVLVGDLTLPADTGETGAPAVLLMHMYNDSRQAWADLVDPLLDAGYAVLAIDLRGHGDTGGARDWELAQQDTQAWVDWLRTQPGVDPARISLIGGSIGSNLALRGMAADEAIVTAIALSPGLDYYGVTTEDAVTAIRGPIFIATALLDGQSSAGVKILAGKVKGDALIRYYSGFMHGTDLLAVPDMIPLIISWLDLYNQPE